MDRLPRNGATCPNRALQKGAVTLCMRCGVHTGKAAQLLVAADGIVGDWGGGRLRVRYFRVQQRLQLLVWPRDGE